MFHEILHCTQQKLALIHCLRKQISMYNRTARRELPPSYASKTACGSYHLYFSSPLLLYQNSEACHIVMQRFLHLVLSLQYPDFGSFCSRWWEEPVEVEGQGVELFIPAVPSERPEPLPPLHPPVLRRVSDIQRVVKDYSNDESDSRWGCEDGVDVVIEPSSLRVRRAILSTCHIPRKVLWYR